MGSEYQRSVQSVSARANVRTAQQYDFVHLRRDVESTNGMARIASHHGNPEAAKVQQIVDTHQHPDLVGENGQLTEKRSNEKSMAQVSEAFARVNLGFAICPDVAIANLQPAPAPVATAPGSSQSSTA